MAQDTGSRPVPDPTVLTTELTQREISALKELIFTRLDGIDSTIELQQEQISARAAAIRDEVQHLKDVFGEKFTSIATQFIERDKRTEQLSIADKTAIAAALQAQKEAAGASNESIAASIAKSEAGFTKQIDQIGSSIGTLSRTFDDKINDVKSRLDKGEGKTSVSDPALAEGMRQLSAVVTDLAKTRDIGTGHVKGGTDTWAIVLAAVGASAAIATVIGVAFRLAAQ